MWWLEPGADPSLLVDDDGSLWAHGAYLIIENPEWDQQTQIWAKAVDRETLKPTGPEYAVWTGAATAPAGPRGHTSTNATTRSTF